LIVVLDTSVWISALEFGGVPQSAVERALNHDQLAVSDFIREEIVRVLTHKFDRDPENVEARLQELLAQALWVEVSGEVHGITRDAADDAILETAWRARAEYLVSGDKDLLCLGTFRETAIIPPSQYVDLQ
jgi:uncharacterized protein